jgi:hypothetical protein
MIMNHHYTKLLNFANIYLRDSSGDRSLGSGHQHEGVENENKTIHCYRLEKPRNIKIFGIIQQYVSVILMPCMRLQDTGLIHTMNVLSMHINYMLLCTIINASFSPAYTIVCISTDDLETYKSFSSELSFG